MNMDWISIAYFAIIGICVIIGLVRGGARDFWRLLVQAAAIGLAFALCHFLGDILYNITGLHDLLYGPIEKFLEPILGDYAHQMVNQEILSEGVRNGFYTDMHLPEIFVAPFDEAVVAHMPEGEFEAIIPFTNALVSLIYVGIAFLVIYLLVVLW